MLGDVGDDRRGKRGLMRGADVVSYLKGFGFFSGNDKSQCRVPNTGGAKSDSVATPTFKWIILAAALRLDSGQGLGSQG